jgi:hypothetical protein
MTEEVGAVMRWFFRGGVCAVAVLSIYEDWHKSLRPHVDYGLHFKSVMTGVLAFTLLLLQSALGLAKLVERGDREWMAKAIRKGDSAWGWQKRHLARAGYAVGLEGFAWYEYTMKFRDLTEEQKAEIRALHQANPRGKWMRQQANVLFDDERIRIEEAQLRSRVQRIMIWVLVGMAFVAGVVLGDGCVVSAHVVVAGLWTLAAMMTTLRQAIPLWTEADPREVAGELIVMGEARA